ncbi:hypothetical protein M408DRAFT_333417 [Serendipita vermifera MAFF 305830]|uniref:Uncharacterized protein n=1 Tax=Serendipita vermifera MAFF 305830 TaxID=933852 RepID=A0A0C2W4W4_SERVB|nr:hypothetical protein M408DRAFT_333417 [Serendipita vermifera MAFF 305830]
METQYLNQLGKLRDSWNPKWRESGVWSLISPILSHFEDEITRRNAFVDHLQEHSLTRAGPRNALVPVSLDYNTSPIVDIPSFTLSIAPQSDTKNNPDRPFEKLEPAYLACSQADRDVQMPSSRSALQKWYSTFDPTLPGPFPEPDLVYRRTTNHQHSIVKECNDWYSNILEVITEKHQQHSEDVKSFIGGYLSSMTYLVADISRSCTIAISNTRSFASASFISPRHDEIEDEKSHLYMRKYEYRHYHLNGELSRPFFGLGAADTVQLVNQVLDTGSILWTITARTLKVSDALKLEKGYLNSPIQHIIAHPDNEYTRMKLLNSLLLLTKPLFLIEAVKVRQYRGGVPRRKLQGLVESIDFEARSDTLQLMVRVLISLMGHTPYPVTTVAEHVGWLFTHQHETGPIINDIGRKWDYERDCPFPEGVERKTEENRMTREVVWVDSGLPYVREG